MAKTTGVYFIKGMVATPEEISAAKAMQWDVLKYVNASVAAESGGGTVRADVYAGAVPESYAKRFPDKVVGPAPTKSAEPVATKDPFGG